MKSFLDLSALRAEAVPQLMERKSIAAAKQFSCKTFHLCEHSFAFKEQKKNGFVIFSSKTETDISIDKDTLYTFTTVTQLSV